MMRRAPRLLSLRPFPTLLRPTRNTISRGQPLVSSHQPQPYAFRKRTFHASATRPKGLSPTSSEPEPPKGEHAGGAAHVAQPATLTTDEYHDLADQYINALVLKLEEMAEESSEKLEVEYSVCLIVAMQYHAAVDPLIHGHLHCYVFLCPFSHNT